MGDDDCLHSNYSHFLTKTRSGKLSASPESYDSPLDREPMLPSAELLNEKGPCREVAETPILTLMKSSAGVPDAWPDSY